MSSEVETPRRDTVGLKQRERMVGRQYGYGVPPLRFASLGMTLLAQEFHDIAPPVDYSLVPPWVIFAASFVGLCLLGLTVWAVMRRMRKPTPEKSPRARALDLLELERTQIEHVTPYEFSIRVSDILRRYVVEEYKLPITRQTSFEFLEAISNARTFSEDERSLLEDFLSRCDLIKFARYEATTADSELLLDEATRFVQGGQKLAVA
ncbi:MAG: DUF4381 family protein [Verrucomicrobiota bacterium]|nr:DUF4381 family protein [Verrucomicrobiota bacterium]